MSTTITADPRPLTGEPLPIDLLNTVWVERSGRRDLLAEDGGQRFWLDLHDPDAPDGEAAGAALAEAREAMRAFLLDPSGSVGRERLNRVLEWGANRAAVGEEGLEWRVEAPPAQRLPWLAALELVTLREQRGERIRRCGNPDCVLWFLDVSRPGNRRWCSMASCGNREKARRFHRAD